MSSGVDEKSLYDKKKTYLVAGKKNMRKYVYVCDICVK